MAVRNPAKHLIALRARAGLSRNATAQRAGFPRGSSLQYYETPASRWEGRHFPTDVVARLVRALVGLGEPPIEEKEIWALAETKAGVTVSASAVVAIPVLEWASLAKGRFNITTQQPVGFIQAVGLTGDAFIALISHGDLGGGQVPAGSHLIVDTTDIELRDGRRFVIIWNEAATVRRYFSNPARFEGDAVPPEPTIFPTGPVEIIGRVVRAVIDY